MSAVREEAVRTILNVFWDEAFYIFSYTYVVVFVRHMDHVQRLFV